MKDRNKSYMCAILVVFFWSTVSSAFKISLRYLSVTELLLYSSFFSIFILLLLLVIKKKIYLIKNLKKKDIFLSLFLGFLNPFLYYLVVLKAYSLLPAQQAQPLNLTWGIVLVIISIPLLGQKLRGKDIFAILISFIGVIAISTEGDFSLLKIKSPLGVSLAVGSSLIWAFYWLINMKDKLEPIVRLFLNFSFGFLYVLLWYILFSDFKTPAIEGILGSLYVGIFEMGVTFFLWITALKLSQRAVNVTILIYLIPFISFVFIHVFVGETILFSSVLGALLIVVGILTNKYDEFKPVE